MTTPTGAAGSGAAYPQWAVNTTTWLVVEVKNSIEKYDAEAVNWPNTLVFFTDQKDAQAYSQAHGGTGASPPFSNVARQPIDVSSGAASSGLDALSTLAGVAHVLGEAITDGKMWRSLGWVILGVFLLIIGIGLWVGQDAVKAIAPALPVIGRFL